jgi:hypothetical protein
VQLKEFRNFKNMVSPHISPSDIKRFEDRVAPVPEVGCWIYTGQMLPNGYGYFVIKKQHIYAHRFAWIVENGPIPDGLVIDHKCSVRCCVNPDHLDAVTQKENSRRTIDKNEKAQGKMTMPDHIPTGPDEDDYGPLFDEGED